MALPPVEQAWNLIRKWLVTPVTDMPPLYQWAHLSWQVSIVVCTVQGWVRPLMSFLLSSLHHAFLQLWKLDIGEGRWEAEFPGWFEIDVFQGPQPKCVASVVIGSYCMITVGNQGQQKALVLSHRLLRLPWLTLRGRYLTHFICRSSRINLFQSCRINIFKFFFSLGCVLNFTY